MYTSKNRNFRSLHALSKECTIIESVHNILEWDQETYMPAAAIELRSQQLEVMAKYLHKVKTQPKFKRLLSQLINIETGELISEELTLNEAACVQRWYRDYRIAASLPKAHVASAAKVCSKALHAWSEAKRLQSFESFAPHLQKIVKLAREKASYLTYKDHPYDALLDLYEPGLTTKILDPLFTKLQHTLTDLLRKIIARPQLEYPFLKLHFPSSEQIAVCNKILDLFPFPSKTTRLDISSHPFCNALNPKDVRMTTRIVPDRPLSSMFSVLHEAGHGLYETQLDTSWYGTPLCQSLSLGIHESQSRLWETFIGRSYPFWKYFFPILKQYFPNQLASIDIETFYQAINHVEPSLIRTEADEVTYCLHVIIRYEIEKDLIAGKLQAKDIPYIWKEKMRGYLGIAPESDDVGCLQDIHWAMGGIGYFPTYALGNLYAAQLFETYSLGEPCWDKDIEKGDFTKLAFWLKENLHIKGRLYTPQQTMKLLCDKDLSENAYIKYLHKKYKNLYQV
jgi:carboxypeptidase Taq